MEREERQESSATWKEGFMERGGGCELLEMGRDERGQKTNTR